MFSRLLLPSALLHLLSLDAQAQIPGPANFQPQYATEVVAADPPPPPLGGMQTFSVSATESSRERSIEFTDTPDLTLSDLAPIPEDTLEPNERRSYLLAQQAGLPDKERYYPNRATAFEMVDAPSLKIQALADQLGGDVVKIYKYVRDNIRTEHQPKANKGAHMTLVLGSGGAADKAALLYSLFRASGKTPGDDIRYVSGRVKFPLFTKFTFGLASLTGWSPQQAGTGLPTQAEIDSMTNDLANAGTNRSGIAFPLKDNAWTMTSVPVDQNYIEAERIWIKVRVDGTWIHLDPAFPRREWLSIPTGNRPAISSYNRQNFLDAFAAAPPAPSSLVPNAGNIHRVGFSNFPAVATLMKQYSEDLYNQYRIGGEKGDLALNEIIGVLQEQHPAIHTFEDLRLFGCPWRVGALGAGITEPFVTSPGAPGYPRETDFLPAEHAWVLVFGHGNDGASGTSRNIGAWAPMYQFLMPAMMGKTLAMEQGQHPTYTFAGRATLRLGGEDVWQDQTPYGLGTGGADQVVLAILGLPRYPTAVPPGGQSTDIYVSTDLRPLYTDQSHGVPQSPAPYAVYNPAAKYLFAWTYLNVYNEGYLQECGERIDALRRQGYADTSNELQLESLNLMISSYSYQYNRMLHLTTSLSEASYDHLYHLATGCYIESKVIVDFQNQYISQNFLRGVASSVLDQIDNLDLAPPAYTSRGWRTVTGWLSSALEHSAVQQALEGTTNKAYSTAKYFAKSSASQPVYVLGSELKLTEFGTNTADIVKVNTTANKYQNYISYLENWGVSGAHPPNDYRYDLFMVLPHVYNSSRESLSFSYVVAGEQWPGYVIGWLGGGVSSLTAKLNPLSLLSRFFSGLAEGLSGVSPTLGGNAINPNAPNAHGNDPVDMRTGAYIAETTDLTVSGQPNLVFSRYYNSARHLDYSNKLGYGWTHNHIKRLAVRSAFGANFGESGRPEDAATLLSAILVLKDLVAVSADDTRRSTRAENRPEHLFWDRTRAVIASTCVATWAGNEMVDCEAVLTIGNTDYRFSRMAKADGDYSEDVTYRSPLGLPEWKLIRNSSGVFELHRRYDGTMIFSAEKSDNFHYCTKDTDFYGNALEYTVNANGNITRVRSNPQGTGTGPYIDLTYDSTSVNGRLTKVKTSTDGAELNLGYFSATDSKKYILVTARPPVCTTAAYNYLYEYDGEARLTKTTDPQGRLVMENFYGGDGRVHRQRAEGLATQEWKYEWFPGMSKEINPKGHTTEFHYDHRSRLIGNRDNEGKMTRYDLDDQDRIVGVFGPDGQPLMSRTYFTAYIHEPAPTPFEQGMGLGNPDKDPREGALLSETQYAVWNGTTTDTGSDLSLTSLPPQDITTTYEYENALVFQGLPSAIETTGQGRTLYGYQNEPEPFIVVKTQGEVMTYLRDTKGNVTRIEIGTDPSPNLTFAASIQNPRLQVNSIYDTRGRLVEETKYDETTSHTLLSHTFFNWAFEPHQVASPSATMSTTTGLGYIITSAGYQTLAEPAHPATSPPVIPTIVVQKMSGKMQRNSSSGIITLATGATAYTTTTTFNAFGDVIRSQDGVGDDGFARVTSQQYNVFGKVTRTVGPQGVAGTPVSTIGYDERGWQNTVTDSLGRTTTTTREYLDRADAVTLPMSMTATTHYDSLGRPSKTLSPMLRETRFAHIGNSSQVATTTNALDQTTSHWINAQGKQVAMTDRNGKQWRFAFDSLGRITATRKPTGEMIRNVWHPARAVPASIQEPSGQSVQFLDHTGDDRILRKKDSVNAGASETVFTYDASLQLSTVTENGQTITRLRDYNNQGQLKRMTNVRGEVFDYVYGSDGLLRTLLYPVDADTTVTLPDSTTRLLTFPVRKSVQYQYDSSKRLTRVTDWAGRITQYQYDLAGRLSKIIRHNGSVCDMAYDAVDRIREIKDSWVSDGRLISLFRLGFNNDSQLTDRFAIPYPYGLAGTPFTGSYGDDNRLLTVNGQAAVHDLDGNLLTTADPLYTGSLSLSYDSRNRLTSSTVRGMSASYTYDAEGTRQTATFGSQTTTYTSSTHGSLSQTLKRKRADGQTVWSVYGYGLLYEVQPDLAALTPVSGSSPAKHTTAEKTLVHHHDQIGNTVAVTDDLQRDVLWVQYDIFGAVVDSQSPVQRDGSPAVRADIQLIPDRLERALAVTPYLFSGQQGVLTDPNGLFYMRARYYHPGLRRFVNPDPIGFEGGNNWYAYAGSNPLMANDPSGLAVRNAGNALGNAVRNTGTFGMAFLSQAIRGNLFNAAVVAGAYPFSFLSGDIWDTKLPVNPNANGLFVAGVLTSTRSALDAGNALSENLNGAAVNVINNNSHYGGLGDIFQILGEELGLIGLPSIWAADAMTQMGSGGLFAHSQGSSVLSGALRLMSSSSLSNFASIVWGGQTFISTARYNLASSTHFRAAGDIVPKLSPWNLGTGSRWTTIVAPGFGLLNAHSMFNYVNYSSPFGSERIE